MSGSRIQRAAVGMAVLALTIVGITACSSGDGPAPDSKYPQLTLAETKSPVQLLRNDVAGRIPQDVIQEIVAARDVSSSCQIANDPDELIRSWNSSLRITLTEASGKNLDSIVDALIASYEAEGWESGTYGVDSIIDLKKTDSIVEIRVSGVAGDEETGADARVQIRVAGPCVVTDGKGSDEVVLLESNS